MDMWDPFFNAVKKSFHNDESLIAFDRFHVSQHIGKALDKVRAEEHRCLIERKEKSPLVRSKYQWLANSYRTDNRATRRKGFMPLTRINLNVAAHHIPPLFLKKGQLNGPRKCGQGHLIGPVGPP